MTKNQTRAALVLILLAAFFLRTYRLLDFPLFGDEVDEGDIALEILHGHLALFYPQNEGNEPLYQFTMAPFFAILGDSTIANRIPSVAWSMVFVALMYRYGRALFNRRVGVMCAALAASLWWTTLFGRLGLREISQPTLMIPALIALIFILRDKNTTLVQEIPLRNVEGRLRPLITGVNALLCLYSTYRIAIHGGIFAGLTAYTFLSGRGFPIIIILFLAIAALTHRDVLKQRARAFAIYFVLMIALAAPLWIYLYLHPELDFHTRDLATQSWVAQRDFSRFMPQIMGTLGMFTVRGEMDWAHNIAGRPALPGIEGWLFYGGVALALWHWRKPEYALQLIVLAVMLAPNVLAENPPRWTRSVGILPGLITLTVASVEYVWARIARFSRTQVAYGAIIALLGLAIYARTAFDFFDVWIDHPGVYWQTLAFYDGAGRYIHVSPDTTPVNYVMDVYADWRKHNVTRAAARGDVEMRFSLTNAFVFPDNSRGARIAFQNLAAPPSALLGSFTNSDAPVFVDARRDPAGNRPLQIYLVPRTRLDERIARAKANPIFHPSSSTRVDSFRVGDFLEFSGYEILNPNIRGSAVNVLTYWRIVRAPPELTIFVHLLDPSGKLVAQYDGFDVVTQDMKEGDIVAQLHALVLPENLPRATYRLAIGAYTRADGKRIPLQPGGDHLWLQTWTPSP